MRRACGSGMWDCATRTGPIGAEESKPECVREGVCQLLSDKKQDMVDGEGEGEGEGGLYLLRTTIANSASAPSSR